MKSPLFAVLLPALAGTTPGQENYSTWAHAKPVVLNTKASGANVAAGVSNIPLLVRLSASNASDVFAQAKGDGADLRFQRLPGTALPYQIERWDTAAKVAEIWVLLDTVRGDDSGTGFHLYWGRSDAPAASSGPAVFQAAHGFMAVWHLGGAGARPNAVAGGNPAVPVNYTGKSWPGVIAGADSMRGGDGPPNDNASLYDHLNLGSGYANFDAGLTYSIWVNPSEVRSWSRFLSMGDPNLSAGTNNTDIALFRRNATDSIQFRCLCTGVAGPAAGGLQLNVWQHFAAVRQPGATGVVRLYKNGLELATVPTTGTLTAAIANTVRPENFIGRSNNGTTVDNDYYAGKVDEPQLSNVARSAAWVKLAYETQRPGSSLMTLGATGVPIGVQPAPEARPDFSVTASGAGLLLRFDGSAAQIRLAVTAPGGRTVWSRILRNAGGVSSFVWDGKADNGGDLAAGNYVIRARMLDAQGNTLGSSQKSVALGL